MYAQKKTDPQHVEILIVSQVLYKKMNSLAPLNAD